MKKNILRTAAFAIFGAVASGAFATAAMAQDVGVTVTAPYVSHQQKVGKDSGAQRVSLQRIVSIRDLDLRRASDRDVLIQRINFAAHETCAELERLYPQSYDTERGCLRDARLSTTRQVNALFYRASY